MLKGGNDGFEGYPVSDALKSMNLNKDLTRHWNEMEPGPCRICTEFNLDSRLSDELSSELNRRDLEAHGVLDSLNTSLE
jgi:hypothetical protein